MRNKKWIVIASALAVLLFGAEVLGKLVAMSEGEGRTGQEARG